ncbi:SpoIIE family protein phosphatase [Streptomyces sp. NPDC002851]
MTDIWGDRDALAHSRERLLGGESAVRGLRTPILRSWQRCQSLGLAQDVIEPPHQPEVDLEGRLGRAAEPVLTRLESEVAGTRVGVILADGQGVILQCRVGDKALYKHLDAVSIAPGFNYSEQYVGTNGIGTALEERRDFHVFGAEHFLTPLRPFVSMGAVIRDPLSGRVAGVVGLTCWCSDAHDVMRSMIREAAEAIERRLLEQHTERSRVLFREFLGTGGGAQEPMAELERELARSGGGTLTDSDQRVLREKAAELISAARSATVQVPLSGGRLATLVCQPMTGPRKDAVAIKLSLPKVSLPEDLPRDRAAATAPGPTAGADLLRAERKTSAEVTSAPAEWLLSVGDAEVGQLAMAARERLGLLYDAGLRIGTTLDVTRTAEELAELVVPRFADFITVDLLEPVLLRETTVQETVVLRRAAVGAREADSPFHPAGQRVSFASSAPQTRCFSTGQAVLEPDLSDVSEWLAQDRVRLEEILQHGVHSLITVALRTRGMVLGVASFYRSGRSKPFEEDDLHLAEELTARVAMSIDNARRFEREHGIALALQRSLLPDVFPEQTAVEVSHRYLPAQAGAGGDWFDIIPLSGTRVALVVGDVVGHGLHATVTMGRLRTAVHNFAALDLSPDELLGRVDDLVMDLDQEEATRPDGGDVMGATCLYAIYDPVSQRCTAARAGHPLPAVVTPDGAVQFPELPAGPPLGLGGLPFESAELRLPEGSQLVLYTDGLVVDRDRDLDVTLEQLRSALAHPDRPPEETCKAVMDALPTPHAGDDVTLLVARTRALAAESITSWDVPDDPAAVADVRAAVAGQLSAWGLEELAFTTEVVVSELVTNAIRHASGPIQLRLLRDRTLICEVSDASSTSPHLRRATDTDEGGRGLFLVAQLAGRWGTRYTARGKVIWTEQPLSPR